MQLCTLLSKCCYLQDGQEFLKLLLSLLETKLAESGQAVTVLSALLLHSTHDLARRAISFACFVNLVAAAHALVCVMIAGRAEPSA